MVSERRDLRIPAMLVITQRLSMAIVAVAVLAACSCSGATTLKDTSWELESLAGNDVLPGTKITLEFSDDQISGSAGCNHYGGGYQAGKDSLSISDVFATEMWCVEPEGVMEQERAYSAALSGAAAYQIEGGRLQILDETGTQTLVLVASNPNAAPTATPTTEAPTPAAQLPPTAGIVTVATLAVVETEPPPPVGPPAGFRQYRDTEAGVSVYIPESWIVTGIVPGRSAILQSYPEDKYVGGEPFEAGDTKCDVNIRPPDVDMAGYLQQLKSDPTVTVVSEQEVTLLSGEVGTRVEVDSMGRSLSLITETNDRVLVLTCFGELAPFDEITVTLGANE
jgi:heat shock protein HslJ